MIHSVRFKVVLDTNVVYPIIIRDLLLWFSHYELFTPKWSEHIFDEWKSVRLRKGVDENAANSRIENMHLAFPDGLVKNYQSLIKTLNLPDPKDCHVLAAAIKTNASIIVTNNLKDFPAGYLEQFGIKTKSADDFLKDIIDLNHGQAIKAFKEMVFHKRNPDLNEFQVLQSYRQIGLTETANYLHALL